ncbi:MAG: hypothetical protein JSW34_11760 [Candidatus Zixiibacteriota bacterium]|nr:MAG: hypothetical protein JSW34_11760 [candidate division Zixibacteria bacterium]
MKIGPIGSDNKGVDSTGKAPDRRPQAKAGQETKRDSLEISTDARRRLARLEEPSPDLTAGAAGSGNVSRNLPERLRRVAGRIESGFYELPAVRDRTIDRLVDEMLQDIKRFYK